MEYSRKLRIGLLKTLLSGYIEKKQYARDDKVIIHLHKADVRGTKPISSQF